MAKEIERKFLMNDMEFVKLLELGGGGNHLRQGYLSSYSATNPATVRLRSISNNDAGTQYKLTIKGPQEGITKDEFEYDVPLYDGSKMWELCQDRLEKVRYNLAFGRVVFEIDVFKGVLEGLVIVEVELEFEDQEFPRPRWLGREVSNDSRYANNNLGKLTEPWEIQTLMY